MYACTLNSARFHAMDRSGRHPDGYGAGHIEFVVHTNERTDETELKR